MYGVVNNFQSFNVNRDNELNPKIYARNIPDTALQPNLNNYPMQTKRSKMQIVDNRIISSKQKKPYHIFDIEKNFNPGTATPPWNGYVTNIDIETQLRTPNPKCNTNKHYIPSSDSNLYNSPIEDNNLGIKEHNLLFKQEQYTSRQPYKQFNKLFNNNTRC